MPAAIPIAAAVAGAVVSHELNKGSDSPSATQTQTVQQQMDPRMAAILFGSGTPGQRVLKPGVTPTYAPRPEGTDGEFRGGGQGPMTNPESDYTTNTDTGLLGRYQGLLDTPQNADMANFGTGQQQWLAANAPGMTSDLHQTANQLMGGNIVPSGMRAATMDMPTNMQAASVQRTDPMQAARVASVNPMQAASVGSFDGAQAAKVNAPSQNGINLSPAYQKMVYGNPAEDPYLTGAIQGGINQSNNAFGNMLGLVDSYPYHHRPRPLYYY